MRTAFLILTLLMMATAATYLLRHHPSAPLIDTPDLPSDINSIRARQVAPLTADLTRINLDFGAALYIRIFKEERQLEVWVAQDGGTYSLFRNYPICNFSGALGPKLREGDHQSPEGFYTVSKSALNPNSAYHLSFNLGFPNRFDRDQGRTGSFLMVHGDCVSVGCYAMTDPAIEEIYVLVEAALNAGQQNVPVHAFPFRPTPARLRAAHAQPWAAFWRTLAPAYTSFEATRIPPKMAVKNDAYVLVPH